MPDAKTLEVAEQPAEKPAQFWFSKIGGLILATGVVGTAISAYFQWRSWEYQSQTDKIDKDVGSALTALRDIPTADHAGHCRNSCSGRCR